MSQRVMERNPIVKPGGVAVIETRNPARLATISMSQCHPVKFLVAAEHHPSRGPSDVGLAVHGGECGDIAERPDWPVTDASTMSLAAILHHANAVGGCASNDGLYFGRPA